MIVVPAIDIRGGKCVRLLHGDPQRETKYEGDPVERARQFVAAGAARLHVVDLDGAFGTGENVAALRAICEAVTVPIQTGGGIRTRDDVMTRFEAGARFVIVGTMLIEDPALVQELLDQFDGRLIAGIDARGNAIAFRGWLQTAPRERDDLLREVATRGFERIVFTEIARDGAGTGYDLEALRQVAGLFPSKVTASGGARTLDDLRALVAGVPENVDSAIVGRALYEGTLDLPGAIAELA